MAGDQGFVDHLASRPIISEEAEEYFVAFQRLSRDRTKTVVGGGMGPAIKEPDPLPLPVIRAEGQRLGFDGEDLEYFIEILAEADGIFLEVRMAQIVDEVSKMLAEMKRRRP